MLKIYLGPIYPSSIKTKIFAIFFKGFINLTTVSFTASSSWTQAKLQSKRTVSCFPKLNCISHFQPFDHVLSSKQVEFHSSPPLPVEYKCYFLHKVLLRVKFSDWSWSWSWSLIPQHVDSIGYIFCLDTYIAIIYAISVVSFTRL